MGLWLLRPQDVNVPQEMIAGSKEVILEQKINLSLWEQLNVKLSTPSLLVAASVHTRICSTSIRIMKDHQQKLH